MTCASTCFRPFVACNTSHTAFSAQLRKFLSTRTRTGPRRCFRRAPQVSRHHRDGAHKPRTFALNGSQFEPAAGSMIVFWSSFTGYSYLQPGLEDFTAMAGAATLFSMGLLGMMNAMK